MGNICLEGLEFYAYHGFYEEERKIGNKYGVDITVETDFDTAAKHDELTGTVDYVQLYAIINKEMAMPSKLLEHVAKRIIKKVLDQFSSVKKVILSISKFNPPIGGVCHRAKITLEEERKLDYQAYKRRLGNTHDDFGLPEIPKEEDMELPEVNKPSGYRMLEELCEK